MTRKPFRFDQWRGGFRGRRGAGQEVNFTDSAATGETDSGRTVTGSGQATPGERIKYGDSQLSAYQRLVLSCLVESGGTQRLVPLARDVSRRMAYSEEDAVGDFRETYLAVHSIVGELTERGLVTHFDNDGTVRLNTH